MAHASQRECLSTVPANVGHTCVTCRQRAEPHCDILYACRTFLDWPGRIACKSMPPPQISECWAATPAVPGTER